MARIRYLNPEFFLDEDLARLSPYHRLAFQGLWCQADRAGRLEDRPQRLKALIFPYENADFDKILTELEQKPFIKRYDLSGRKYIQILNFLKYQHPHHTERDSEIPSNNGELPVTGQLVNSNLRDEHLSLSLSSSYSFNKYKDININDLFNNVWKEYPKRVGRKQAITHFKSSVKNDKDYDDIEVALKNYLSSKRVQNGYIQNGSTWFNNWRDWLEYQEKMCPNCKDKGKFISSTGYEIVCDCPVGKGTN